jgi:hypothetical protein
VKTGKIIFSDQAYFLKIKGRRVEYETVYSAGLGYANVFFIVPAYRLQRGHVIADLLNGPTFVVESDEETNEVFFRAFHQKLKDISLVPESEWINYLPHAVSENSSTVDE